MKRLFLLVLLVTGIATAASCSKRVIARINGEKITQDEFLKELEQPQTAMPVLNSLLMTRMVEQEAKKKGVEVTDAEVASLIKKQKDLMGDRWDEQLKKSGLTQADLEKVTRQQLLFFKVFISDAEARKFFEDNHAQFDTPATARLRRIVLKSKDEAEKVRQEILAGKAKFEDVAREKSLDQFSARQGGELGPVPILAYGQAQPQLMDILEKQPLNEISEPVANNTPEGSFQIVEVIERNPGEKVKFEDKWLEVYQAFYARRRAEILNAVNELQAKATVEILDPRYNALQEQWREVKERKPTAGPTPALPSAQPKPAQPGAEKGSKTGNETQPNKAPESNVKSKPPAPKAGS